jgi:hypothetical protein
MLEAIKEFFLRLWRWLWRKKEEEIKEITPPPIMRWSTLEILSAPQHGKTSYLWALSHMARNLGLFWPRYACWPPDAAMDTSFRAMLTALDQRQLPTETSDSSRLGLSLLSMARWGDRRLFVEDDRDPVFGLTEGTATNSREVNWGVPIVWLLSLPDLGTEGAQFIDLQLENLVRARLRSGRSFEGKPLRLVIALTKADRIPGLPPDLRDYLKADPLAEVVEVEAASSNGGKKLVRPVPHFDDGEVEQYLKNLREIHQKVATWLATTLPGSLLARRAESNHIDLRFCLTSATGSDLRSNEHLAIPWRPRRVLDPLFWALELGCR